MKSINEVVKSAVEKYFMGFFTKSQTKEVISWGIREDRPWVKSVKVKLNRKSVRLLTEQVDVNGNPLEGLVLNIVKL